MASGKASITSFFSKPSSSMHPKSKELAQPAKKNNSNSPNMFDDQSLMDVDECEEIPVATKTESQVKKRTTVKNNKKRSIVDVDGKHMRHDTFDGSTYTHNFNILKMVLATRYLELHKRAKKLRKSTKKQQRSRNTHAL